VPLGQLPQALGHLRLPWPPFDRVKPTQHALDVPIEAWMALIER
jgi:hypothetical protein